MKVVSTVTELREKIREYGLAPVGLVPTMGALHEGHLSLMGKALAECPVAVASIFVNPNQFNDKNDLKNYPRTPDSDLKLLDTVLREKDIVFTPPVGEIYPEEDKRQFRFGNLDNVMEALHRPGHFNGVAQVVSRLFEIVEPDIAFFGIKDFQQLAVIKEMTRQIGSSIRIVGCPIVREKDGLAMSSRNRLLDPETRKLSPVIFKTISMAAGMIKERDIPEIKKFVTDSINSLKGFNVEYFEIADDRELIPINKRKEMKSGSQYYGCIAVKAVNIRLIDNIKIDWVERKG
jgi:pantoate--beta-alanine ligase